MTPLEVQKAKNRILAGIRSFFDNREFLEVQTPLLSPGVIPESSIEVFATRMVHPNRNDQPLFLLPSPELWMKKLLAQGFPSLWQISRSFRNAESIGQWHNPEFSMLEWYWRDRDYQDNLNLTLELMRSLTSPRELPQWFAEPAVIRMEKAFLQWTGIDLREAQSWEDFQAAARSRGHEYPSAQSWEELFHFMLIELVEPRLPQDRLVFLQDYPIQIPTTAKGLPGGPYYQRWEVYFRGIELANCYTEENDPEKILPLLAQESRAKAGALVPILGDPELEGTISKLPPCSGVALGLDRLLALLLGCESIKGVINFPFYGSLPGKSSM
jgi:lysyl-tRNA synthetase class 2